MNLSEEMIYNQVIADRDKYRTALLKCGAELDEATAERDTLRDTNTKLQAELKQAKLERDAYMLDRDTFKAKVIALEAVMEEHKRNQNLLADWRGRLAMNLQSSEAQLRRLTTERDNLGLVFNQVTAAQKALTTERDVLKSGNYTLQGSVDLWKQQHDNMSVWRDEEAVRVQDVTTERDALKVENDTLREKLRGIETDRDIYYQGCVTQIAEAKAERDRFFNLYTNAVEQVVSTNTRMDRMRQAFADYRFGGKEALKRKNASLEALVGRLQTKCAELRKDQKNAETIDQLDKKLDKYHVLFNKITAILHAEAKRCWIANFDTFEIDAALAKVLEHWAKRYNDSQKAYESLQKDTTRTSYEKKINEQHAQLTEQSMQIARFESETRKDWKRMSELLCFLGFEAPYSNDGTFDLSEVLHRTHQVAEHLAIPSIIGAVIEAGKGRIDEIEEDR